MPTQKIRVKGLTRADEKPVAEALQTREGVLYALLNHRDECAEVEFDDDLVSPEDLLRHLAGLGFEAELAG